jgi:FkbM family methyltransferase
MTNIPDYSQTGEQPIIFDYFDSKNCPETESCCGGKHCLTKGTFLDIGANDGKTFSNTHALALNGWSGVCVEPSTGAFQALKELYKDNKNIGCFNFCLGAENKEVDFHECHDSLVSSTVKEETTKWKKNMGFKFEKKRKQMFTYDRLLELCKHKQFDFINIDTEGVDFDILKQINLTDVKMICVEVNDRHRKSYIDYCEVYGMKLIKDTNINLIFAK